MTTRVVLLKNPTPNEDKDVYAVASRQAGFKPWFVPVLAHSFVGQDNLQAKLCQIASTTTGSHDVALIVTSQRAVEAMAAVLDRVNASVAAVIRNMPAYTVGPATANLLRSHGFNHVRGGDDAGNGQILAQLIVHDKLRQVFFLTGRSRRDVIPVTLAKNAIAIEEIVVYESANLASAQSNFNHAVGNYHHDDDDNDNDDVTWVVFFSPTGAIPIVNLLKQRFSIDNNNSVRIAAIGPTTQAFLADNNIPPVVVAGKPDPESLLDAIKQHL
ncbi:tetrapyrrole biosynthesis, uroporphyrinogen III synthase [Lipomyces japonicus]|uniref:tetrapyrrole biosynthesis, uroporphyrinogen III synthase n=1 Tax=Lipomyces japonicus TaxID=56871 RepID=UPI0034CE0B7C